VGELSMEYTEKQVASGCWEYRGYEIRLYLSLNPEVECDKHIFMYGVKEAAEHTGFGHSLKECKSQIDKLGHRPIIDKVVEDYLEEQRELLDNELQGQIADAQREIDISKE